MPIELDSRNSNNSSAIDASEMEQAAHDLTDADCLFAQAAEAPDRTISDAPEEGLYSNVLPQIEGGDCRSQQPIAGISEQAGEIEAVFRANPVLADMFENAVTSYMINPENGSIVNEETEYNNVHGIRTNVRIAELIRKSLPPVADENVRLWRGNRPGEVGQNPSYTNSLVGIALPFLRQYGGQLSYVDVPRRDLQQYLCTVASAPDSEFILSAALTSGAVAIDEVPYQPSVQALELYSQYASQGGNSEVVAARNWLKNIPLKLLPVS